MALVEPPAQLGAAQWLVRSLSGWQCQTSQWTGGAALERIVYLFDKTRALSYRVRMFVRAAAAVAELSPKALTALIAVPTLEQLAGVGTVIGRVIEEGDRQGSLLRPSFPS